MRASVRLKYAPITLLLVGCAEIEDVPDGSIGGGRLDALVGFTNDAAGPVVQPDARVAQPEMGMPPRDQFVPPDQGPCNPGEVLGPCSVCGPDSAPVAPQSDPTCPGVNCTPFNYYVSEVQPDGSTVCDIVTHNPTGPNCFGVARCREADNVICVASPGVEVLRTSGECEAITGCNGVTEGAVAPAPAGTLCENEAGLCTPAGTCDTTISEECNNYLGLAQICGAGTHPINGPYCTIAPADAVANCTTFCPQFGSTCAGAYAADGAGCVQGEEIGCLTGAANLICLCRR
jgi:hypothetical protein